MIVAIGGADDEARQSADGREDDEGDAERVADAQRDEVAVRNLRADSDSLLGAVRELRNLEAEKRTQEISTPEFHETAREITERARGVFRLAAEEEKHGAQTGEPQRRSTNEVPASDPAAGSDPRAATERRRD